MNNPAAKPSIEKLETYKPNFGKSKINNLIRLSANESALGTSLKAIKVLNSFTHNLNRYPPQASDELISAIANRYYLDKKKIILGNGSDELISIISQAFLEPTDEAIYTEFGFLQFPQAISVSGAKGVVAKDVNFTANVDNILSNINKKTKVVFLANANNPTGTFIPKQEVIRLHKSIPSNILLVYDAAYSEYINNNDYIDGSSLVDNHENVIMLRTFSKLHGLASLRLGWGYCSENILSNLMKVRGPFSVNTAAILAGIAAIKDIEFQEKSVLHNLEWMRWFEKKLKLLNLEFQTSVTNFLLIKFPKEGLYSAQNAEKFLAEKGILVRGMNAYNLPNYLRVSIGNEEENITFIKQLKNFLDN
ncbi:histidinol-phosphate transaminase [Alphaproteobacteria bacterium]|nr:histidinol-phosphate transaminase [Alphaproteobacteria bacterium]